MTEDDTAWPESKWCVMSDVTCEGCGEPLALFRTTGDSPSLFHGMECLDKKRAADRASLKTYAVTIPLAGIVTLSVVAADAEGAKAAGWEAATASDELPPDAEVTWEFSSEGMLVKHGGAE